jgi:hypothetical protein
MSETDRAFNGGWAGGSIFTAVITVIAWALSRWLVPASPEWIAPAAVLALNTLRSVFEFLRAAAGGGK